MVHQEEMELGNIVRRIKDMGRRMRVEVLAFIYSSTCSKSRIPTGLYSTLFCCKFARYHLFLK